MHRSTSSAVLMLDLEGTQLTPAERELLAHPLLGGVILFSRNYSDREQLSRLCASIRACDPRLLIAVDQEGGRVQRLRHGFTRLPPMRRFGELWSGDPEGARTLAREAGWLMASEVLAGGIDFSFAPVLDLGGGPGEVIGDRAFAETPEAIAELAGAFIDGMHEAGMASTGKHFPGHGSVRADSHVAVAEDARALEEIRGADLDVFRRCLPRLDAIMPAHVRYPRADAHCAGFSPFWLQSVLRGELDFDGVLFSDDLSMAGAGPAGGIEQRADAALAAGCDMVLVCNDRPAAMRVLEHLEASGTGGSDRPAAMRARGRPDWPELEASRRRRQAIESLHRLSGDEDSRQ